MQTSLPVPQPPEPLAARMRPRTLDEYIGQEHILGPGRLLRRAIEADQLGSILLHGPPGTGKTTLARVVAGSTASAFTAMNAVLAGVKDIREAVEAAAGLRKSHGRRTILFVDEVHRFNKAQQDALLPWVENGTVVLIGATTENPYFEVNRALVSRSRVFQLRGLGPEELRAVARQALADPERGYGRRRVVLADDALAHLVDVCNGDARALLNALELAVETTPPDGEGVVAVDLSVAEESIQRRAVLYDKEGDAHFDTISAFIKSVRGSDPDAALYWLARMVHAGEEPRFVFRRLLVLASEDVGLADPGALPRVVAHAEAFDRVGLPEGRFHLAVATLDLCLAPKSHSAMGFFQALAAVEATRQGEVPAHLKDPNQDGAAFGHGAGYQYPHAFRDHWVAQQYLPENLRDRVFYQPSDQGFEGQRAPLLDQRREAQLAAMMEGSARVEHWTTGPADPGQDRWHQRAASQAGERLGALRDALFEAAELRRHHRVLDLCAGAGLLTWEALRRAPEGQVTALVRTEEEAAALRGLAERLPELHRPKVRVGGAEALAGEPRQERILGRDLLVRGEGGLLAAAVGLLDPAEGRLLLVEGLHGATQRLVALLSEGEEDPARRAAWAAAEDAVYADPEDPRAAWDEAALVGALEALGLRVEARRVPTSHAVELRPGLIARWLAPGPESWLGRMTARLPPAEVEALRRAVRRLEGATVAWRGEALLLVSGHAT
jgi:putative ATPase